ncbi:hypothetical protein ACGRHY_00260 [Streptomyces sp. HK10]|uniref:hypothetical protein n=1 Tax=Streptomyces sp. HK10 TaxID=3373255 RepID=UPI00374A06A5
MSATRRTVLGATAAAPLLAQFTGTASAAADDRWGTISGGWAEVRWTEQVQAELGRLKAVVEAVAPARMVEDSRGQAVRFTAPSGKGSLSLKHLPEAAGSGTMEGGIAIRTQAGGFRVVNPESVLRDGVASGRCVVNGVEVGHRSVFRCALAEGLLTTDGAPAGRPLRVRIGEVPLRPTPELLEVYSATFGTPVFTADTVVAYVTAEGLYTPPKP